MDTYITHVYRVYVIHIYVDFLQQFVVGQAPCFTNHQSKREGVLIWTPRFKFR